MKRDTHKALLASLGLHIALIIVVSPLIIHRSTEVKDHLSVDILKTAPIRRVSQRMLRIPWPSSYAQANEKQASSPLASPTYALQATLPKVPIHVDVATTVITSAKVTETAMPAAPNASLGKDTGAAGPVGIRAYRGTGSGIPGYGSGRKDVGTHRFVTLTQIEDLDSVDLGDPLMGIGSLNSGMIPAHDPFMGLGIFSTVVMPRHGLVGEVYIPGGAISRMPVFEHLTPVHTFVTANLDVPTRNYTEGFSTQERQDVIENFAIRFRGTLVVDISGSYTFCLFSDDGSKLYINGTLVVDNDGIHPPQPCRGSIMLDAGPHPVEIHYFQGPQHEIALQWLYQPPDSWERIVPPELIFLPSK